MAPPFARQAFFNPDMPPRHSANFAAPNPREAPIDINAQDDQMTTLHVTLHPTYPPEHLSPWGINSQALLSHYLTMDHMNIIFFVGHPLIPFNADDYTFFHLENEFLSASKNNMRELLQ